MRRSRFCCNERGAAGVLGALLLFAILAGVVIYVNAYLVPEKGAQWERVQARVMDANVDLVAAAASTAPLSGNGLSLPLTVTPELTSPSLLRGIILDPGAPEAVVGFDAVGGRIRVSHVTAANATVYDLGNASAGAPLGVLRVDTAGRYIAPLTYAVEAGAAFHGGGGGEHLAQPPAWARRSDSGGVDTVALTVPRFTGASTNGTVSGSVTVGLEPLVAQRVGGVVPAARSVTIELWTPRAAAWGAWLNATFAPAVATVSGGADPRVAISVASVGGGASLALDLRYVEYGVELR